MVYQHAIYDSVIETVKTNLQERFIITQKFHVLSYLFELQKNLAFNYTEGCAKRWCGATKCIMHHTCISWSSLSSPLNSVSFFLSSLLSETLRLLDELVSPSSGFFSCLISLREWKSKLQYQYVPYFTYLLGTQKISKIRVQRYVTYSIQNILSE